MAGFDIVRSQGRSLINKYVNIYQASKEAAALLTNQYQVVPATTPLLEETGHRIRYDVYCRELGYEEGDASHREADCYDSHAAQLLLFDRSAQQYIGCVRLVHGRQHGQSYMLPFEEICGDKLDQRIVRMVKESGEPYLEVSRLTIDRPFRNKSNVDIAEQGEKKSRVAPSALITLYLGVQAYAQTHHAKYLFALVERKLLRGLHRLSIPAFQIGESVEHRGGRVPVMIEVKDIEAVIPRLLRPKYNAIKASMT